MNPTLDWLHAAEDHIRTVLDELRPKLLETQGKIEHKLKNDKTAVTEMDTLVEDRLRAALQEFDASIPFSGEESGADYTQKTLWLVDPIDGTEPFIRGLPFATNMITLIDNGEPVMGIINNFGLGEYFSAIKGQGASCNGHPIQVSSRPLNRSFVSIGRPDPKETGLADISDRVRRFMGGGALMNVGATGYVMSAIAGGNIEARISYKGSAKPWDFAPGCLLIAEAGGRVANIGSDAYDYRNVDLIAANAVVFDDLMRFVQNFPSGAA